MRMQLTLCLLGMLVCQGCAPLANVACTSIIEPLEYCRCNSDRLEAKRNRKLAEAAWLGFLQKNPHNNYSTHFRLGFQEGFMDYLYAGGTGSPPPVPPRSCWKTDFESPDGRRSIESWYAGFSQGAQAAKSSGYRELVTIPSPEPFLTNTETMMMPPAPANLTPEQPTSDELPRVDPKMSHTGANLTPEQPLPDELPWVDPKMSHTGANLTPEQPLPDELPWVKPKMSHTGANLTPEQLPPNEPRPEPEEVPTADGQ